MSRERTVKFREKYRSRIAGWYNGYFHVLTVYATGTAVLYLCAQHIANVTPLEWLTVPVVFLATNWFEWDLHKNMMHRPSKIKALQIIYRYHMLNHHQYFTDEDMYFHDHRDWRITIFPPYAITILILISVPFAALVGSVFSANSGWLFISVVAAVGMIYEFIHLCCHCKENWFVRNCPLINTTRRHHAAHHNMRLMTNVNMNVTFPIADWLFGTSDLNRGLIGHLLNGYDTRYLKKDLIDIARLPGDRANHAIDGQLIRSADR
jgi:hypothetical protein